MYYFSGTLPIKSEKKPFAFLIPAGKKLRSKFKVQRARKVREWRTGDIVCHSGPLFLVTTPEAWQAMIYQIVDKLQIKQNYVKLTWEVHFVLDQWAGGDYFKMCLFFWCIKVEGRSMQKKNDTAKESLPLALTSFPPSLCYERGFRAVQYQDLSILHDP